jgi:CelD/BcsL family acetyltransferase involved in cellulose biosynthesis
LGKEDNKISIRAITDIKDILPIEHQWNTLVNESSKNPFLLSEFTKQFMESTVKGWTPLIIVISVNNRVLGIAPLKTKKSYLGRYIESLNPPWCSEFFFEEQYRNTCIGYTLDFIFNTLKCKFASFTLPEESPNLTSLIKQCKPRKIHLNTTTAMAHRIVPITSTWTKFEASRTKNFRKDIRRIKRNLDKMGSWKTICAEGKEQSGITEKILSVEERSWKEIWRAQKGEKDWILTSILRAASQSAKIEPNFKWNVWFLELKDKIISYILAIEYKEVVYFVKTSHDEQYKRFHPGILIQHSAIQEQFTIGQNKYIDFLTDLPYHQKWTDKCLSRVGVQLIKGTVPTFAQFMLKNTIIQKISSHLF